jgi:hypothetical protein
MCGRHGVMALEAHDYFDGCGAFPERLIYVNDDATRLFTDQHLALELEHRRLRVRTTGGISVAYY